MGASFEIRPLVIDGAKTSFKPEQANNIYLLVRGKKAVLVDGCYEHEQSRNLIASSLEGLELTDILVTHFHPDHAESAAKIRERYGARLWADPRETKIGKHVQLDEIDRPFLETDEVLETGAGIRLKSIKTPGHTLSHTCFFSEETGTLFTGDHVIGEGTPWVGPPHGNVKSYLESLQKCMTLPLQEIRGGHGPLVGDPQAKLKEYYEHRMMRERQILAELDKGPVTIPALVATIYKDVDPRVHGLAALVMRGHLDKLLSEGRVREYEDKGQARFEKKS
ncbi:MAG: MBL fold metallo-hydrolase [Bdellovibrionota bacterium]